MKSMTTEQSTQVEKLYKRVLLDGIAAGPEKTTDVGSLRSFVDFLYKDFLDCEPPEKLLLVKSEGEAIETICKFGDIKSDIKDRIFYANSIRSWVEYYFAGVTILKETEGVEQNIDQLLLIEKTLPLFYALVPCDDTCVFIDFPNVIAIKDNDLDKFIVHREQGLAVEYKDGTGLASLNGITVPEYIVMTPKEELSVLQVLAETNVDVRREGLAKIGDERVMSELPHTVIDVWKDGAKVWCDYKLLEIDFGGNIVRCLKMYSPADRKYIYEGVDITCKTCKEALAFRDREAIYIEPMVIT